MNKKKFKGILGIGALVLVSTVLILSGCSQPTDFTNTNIEQIPSLSNPVVKVSVYPGVNLLSWDYVKDAGSYQVTRKDSNGITTILADSISSVTATTTFVYFDKVGYNNQLKDQESYTYIVTAIPYGGLILTSAHSNYGVGSVPAVAKIPAWNDETAVNPVWVPEVDDVTIRRADTTGDYLEVIWQDPVVDPTKTPDAATAVGTNYNVKYVYGALGESLLVTVNTPNYGTTANVSSPGTGTYAPVTPIRRVIFPLLGGTPVIEIDGYWDEDNYYAAKTVPKTGTAVTKTVLDAVTGFSGSRLATISNPTLVTLTWTAVTGATGYDIYRTENNGSASWEAITVSPILTNAGLTSYKATDTTAAIDKAYNYAIVAKAEGNARSSAPAFGTAPANASVSAPTTLNVQIASAKDKQIAISWTATEGVTYKLEKAIIDNATGSWVDQTAYVDVPLSTAVVVNGVQTVVDISVEYWTSYRYKLSATKANGMIDTVSQTMTTTDPFNKSVTIGTFDIAQSDDTVYAIDVTVPRSNAASIYDGLTVTLYRAEVSSGNIISGWGTPVVEGVPFTQATPAATPTFKYTDSGLDPKVSYTYRVDVYAGTTLLKNSVTATTPASIYPSTAYEALYDHADAKLNYSTDAAQSAAILEVAVSDSANKDQYPILKGARLYTFAADGTPSVLGTIEYKDSGTTLATATAGQLSIPIMCACP